MKHLIFIVALAACGHKSNVKEQAPIAWDQVEAMYSTYLSLQPSQRDHDGFIMSDECDSLLWSGLTGALDCHAVNLTAARHDDGVWERRPLSEPGCSDTSRDMFYGVLAYSEACSGGLDILQEVASYGRAHKTASLGWQMYTPTDGRAIIEINQQSIIAEAIDHLGGGKQSEAKFPQPSLGSLTGFQAHLQEIGILEHGKATGGISDGDLKTLVAESDRQPKNFLYSAAVIRYAQNPDQRAKYSQRFFDSILNQSHCPADRLPTSTDRCSDWVTQRDDGPDWQPCPGDGKSFTGGDCLFAAAVALGKF